MVALLVRGANRQKGKVKGGTHSHKKTDPRMHDASRGRFKFALTCTVGMFVSDDVAYEHLNDLPFVVEDGPKGGMGMRMHLHQP